MISRQLRIYALRRISGFTWTAPLALSAYWSEKLRPLVQGIERADSLAFDLHKWGYMPYDIGCVLVRDAEGHKAAFATGASYLTAMERGPAAGGLRFADRGIELSRGFRALKAWMSLKARGVDAIAAAIEQNVEQARYLVSLVKACPELELAAEAPLNIVCLRYAGANDTENSEILMRLQESGIAVPSGTMLEWPVCDSRGNLKSPIATKRLRSAGRFGEADWAGCDENDGQRRAKLIAADCIGAAAVSKSGLVRAAAEPGSR